MGIFDFFGKKDVVKKNSQKFYLPSEVSTIIRPRTTSSRFEDLNGTYVGKVSSSKKDYCREKGCYLGLKKFKNSERWVLIKTEDVTPFLKNKDFIFDHMCEKSKQKIIDKKLKQEKEVQRLEKLKKSQNKILKQLDKDGNGIIDMIEGDDDFMKLLRKHQSVIIEFDKSYIDHLVKISNYLKTKRSNIQKIFSKIQKTKNQSNLKEHVGLLKNQIHTYEVILFHSLSMITSVVEKDLITVREIYEEFDKLNVFNSNWENEMSQTLSDIDVGISNLNYGISNLMYSINSMERNIVSGLNTLSYVTQDGFSDLNSSLSRELQSIDSSIQSNNLLTGIQTYQLYKINKQTKGLIE
jgi:hypothetical protein